MAKDILSIVDGGENIFFTGSAEDFGEDLAAASACGFTSPDIECEWSAEAVALQLHAQGLERGFGKVTWVSHDGGHKVLLVVG